MSGLTNERLVELRQLHEAGSPAGWEACDLRDEDPGDESGGWYLSGPFTIDDGDGSWLNEADTKLIAATRNALPDLLAEVERLQAENRRLCWLSAGTARGEGETMGLTEAGLSQAGWNQIRAEVAEGSRLTALESRLVISEITRLREHLVAKDLGADLAMKQTEDVIAALDRAELAEQWAAFAEQRAAKARIEILEAHVVLERLGAVGTAPLSVRVERYIEEERKVAEEQLAAAEQRAERAETQVAEIRKASKLLVSEAEECAEAAEQQLAVAGKQHRHLDYLALLVHRTHSADGTDYDGCTHADCRYSVSLRAEWRALKGE